MFYIFEVRTHEGYTPEEYAEAWVRASELIQRAPGARGTRLLRRIGADDALLAIASWESKAARDASVANQDETVEAIIRSQAPFIDVRVIGEFEDPEWVVLPPGHAGEPCPAGLDGRRG